MSVGSKQFFWPQIALYEFIQQFWIGKFHLIYKLQSPCILIYRLDKKKRLKICREACRPFQIHAYCCIDLILKKMKMQAIPDISSIPGLCFRQCHSQDSWGTVSIDILSLSFWFFWVLLTVPYSTFLLTVIYQ